MMQPAQVPWDPPGKNTLGGCQFLPQGSSPHPEFEPGPPVIGRQILYHLGLKRATVDLEVNNLRTVSGLCVGWLVCEFDKFQYL